MEKVKKLGGGMLASLSIAAALVILGPAPQALADTSISHGDDTLKWEDPVGPGLSELSVCDKENDGRSMFGQIEWWDQSGSRYRIYTLSDSYGGNCANAYDPPGTAGSAGPRGDRVRLCEGTNSNGTPADCTTWFALKNTDKP